MVVVVVGTRAGFPCKMYLFSSENAHHQQLLNRNKPLLTPLQDENSERKPTSMACCVLLMIFVFQCLALSSLDDFLAESMIVFGFKKKLFSSRITILHPTLLPCFQTDFSFFGFLKSLVLYLSMTDGNIELMSKSR